MRRIVLSGCDFCRRDWESLRDEKHLSRSGSGTCLSEAFDIAPGLVGSYEIAKAGELRLEAEFYCANWAVPLFTDATQNRLLQGELTESGSFRPPFAFMWRYVGAWNGNITQEAYGQADNFLSQQAADEIGLPAEQVVRHVSSDKLRLFAGSEGGFDENTPLMWSNIGFISDLAERVRIIEGEFPSDQTDQISH